MKRVATMILFCLMTAYVAAAQNTTGSVSYSTPDRGGAFFETAGGTDAMIVGYGRVQPSSSTTPTGVAIFGLRGDGILLTEAGVPAAAAIMSGRTFAEVNGPINTGLAMANPNSFAVTISFFFTDDSGSNSGERGLTIGANQQIAAFINEDPFNVDGSFAGTFTFSASAPVAVIALRTATNERGEFSITTQTVSDIATVSSSVVVFGHFAVGGGWRTQVILINPTDVTITGKVEFFDEGSATAAAAPLTLNVNGQVGASFNYTIRARSFARLVTSSPVTVAARVGSIRVTPSSLTRSPSGFTIFSFIADGRVVAEASVPAESTGRAFRTYVEASGEARQPTSIQSGIAITNTSSTAATVNFELTRLDGTSAGLTASTIVSANGHVSKFLDELFPTLTLPFRGILRISSGVSPIVVASLRSRYNERGDFLITTTPVSNEASSSSTAEVFFPHVVDRGGYNTQFILFSGIAGQSTTGNVRFFSQVGRSLSLTVQ